LLSPNTLYVGVPSPQQRLEILLALLSEREHCLLDEDVQHLAGVTHGFVGADLAALCNEAAFVCLRRYISMSTGGSGHNPSIIVYDSCSSGVPNRCFDAKYNEDCSMDDLEDIASSISKPHFPSSGTADGIEVSGTSAVGNHILKVTLDDFEKARMKVRPSAMREVLLRF
jgi:SpoVK/Ycf46/Vps4 family AAA+-type ATPase